MQIKTRLQMIAVLSLAAALTPVTASAKGDPAAGKTKSVTCQACHGVDGKSIDPSYPNLAGQYASYLEKSLHDYQSGKRTNMIMGPMAAPLSEQDIKDISAWYASQEGLQDLSIK